MHRQVNGMTKQVSPPALNMDHILKLGHSSSRHLQNNFIVTSLHVFMQSDSAPVLHGSTYRLNDKLFVPSVAQLSFDGIQEIDGSVTVLGRCVCLRSRNNQNFISRQQILDKGAKLQRDHGSLRCFCFLLTTTGRAEETSACGERWIFYCNDDCHKKYINKWINWIP